MNTTTTALVIPDLSHIDISATKEALLERDRLLSLARSGKAIANAASAQRAAEILKELKFFTREIESARKICKAPVLDLTQRLDSTARELVEDLENEATRISKLIGEWQAEQSRIAEEARRKAYEEEQRIRREAEAKERAEQERLAADQRAREEAALKAIAEAEAKAAGARNEAARARAFEEAKAAREKAERDAEEARKQAAAEGLKRDEQEAIAIGKAHASAAVAVQTKTQGISARRNVEFEVTDIVELYEAIPVLVNLSPNTAAIKAALKQLPEGKNIPGIRHWFSTSAIVR